MEEEPTVEERLEGLEEQEERVFSRKEEGGVTPAGLGSYLQTLTK